MAEEVEVADAGEFVSFEAAMAFLGTSKATLYRLLSQKALVGLKVGRQWRFRKADLVAYVERKPSTVSSASAAELDGELEALQVLGEAEGKSDEEKVMALVNRLLTQAIKAGASDLHLESARLDAEACLLVRNRIDGVLHEVRRLPASLEKPIVERLKVMADLSLEERAMPQDGRMMLRCEGQNFDARVAWTPASFGGSLVVRFVAQCSVVASLEQMGLDEEVRGRLERWMARPNGLILLAGQSGSGKTSTFYALLSSRARPAIKTLTIEDPVEMAIPYTTQVWANTRAGLTFASALRAFLRQDPDIIGLGEMRDEDSAKTAAQAAMTGHLLVATLSARSAAESVSRLLDLGLPPFIISSTLIGTTAQLLVRRLCPDCKQPGEPDPALLAQLEEAGGALPEAGASTWARAVGCEKCRRTGYRGRVLLMEVLEVGEPIARALSRGADREEVEALAVEAGMKTLAVQGAERAARGETSVEEVLRVLFVGGP